MKKIIVLLVALFTFAFAQSQVVLSYLPNSLYLGKIEVTHPVTEVDVQTGDTITYDSRWILCAKAAPNAEFQYWKIRYYSSNGYGSSVLNDTVYDDCIEFDTAGIPYYEIAFRAIFAPTDLNIDQVQESKLVLYPNPVETIVWFNNILEEFQLLDINGKILEKGFNIDYLDMSDYEPGLYILQTDLGSFKLIKL